MLSFFKPAKLPSEPVQGEKVDAVADIAIESTPVQDAPAHGASDLLSQDADEAHPRVSAASVPTIDSTPTIQGQPVDQPRPVPPGVSIPAASLAPPSPAQGQGFIPSVHTQSSQSDRPMHSQSQSTLPYSSPAANASGKDPRRFSFPSFAFLRSDSKKKKKTRTVPPPLKTQAIPVSRTSEKKPRSGGALSVFIVGSAASSEKRAKDSAAIARSVIIGAHNFPSEPSSNKSKPPSKSDVARVKAQLLEPKTAAKVISQLRALPALPNDTATNSDVPIHAVCLNMSDRDIHEQYFAQLESVATASVLAVSAVLADLQLVDLVTAPNMGFGAPVTAQGLFAGAVPTAETVIEGIEQITPQLMALGYATGKAILPDHKGIFAPSDRISVLTCQVYSTFFFALHSSFKRQIGGVSKSVFLLQLWPT